MSFADIVFQLFTGFAGGDLTIPVLFIIFGLAGMMTALRFPLGAAYMVILGLTYGLVTYVPVPTPFFTFYIFVLILLGIGLGLFFWQLFNSSR